MSRVLLIVAVLAVATALGVPAQAQEQRAKELFALGNEHFDRGDFQRAAEAFEQAYGLVDYPIILYNLALSYEGLRQPVAAVTAFERLLARPGKLRAEHVARARASLEAQRQQVTELTVRCNVDGATLRVNGRDVGSSPLSEPVRVAIGLVVVEASRPGYQTVYVPVQAAAGMSPLMVELTEAASRPAQIKVHTSLPAAELWVDGHLVALTPLRSTIAVAPSQTHRVELRREGYLPAGESLTLGEGALSEITLEPRESPAALRRTGGRLRLVMAQPHASVYVDERRRDVGADGSLPLPPGLHVVTARLEGYDPLTLNVVVPRRGEVTAAIDLVPTPSTRAELIGAAERERTWGWSLAGGGAALSGAATALLVWSLTERAAAADERAGLDPVRDPRALDLAIEEDNMTGVAIGSGIGLGVGAAALGAGIIVLATSDDPDRYRLDVDDELFAWWPIVDGGPTHGFVGVRGTF